VQVKLISLDNACYTRASNSDFI